MDAAANTKTKRKRPPYTIRNVVSTFNLDIKSLPIKTITIKSGLGELNQTKFAAMLIKLKYPRASILLFHSNRGVITGAKSESESRLGSVKTMRIMKKLGYSVSMKDFKVQNIVCTGSAGFCLKLTELAADYSLEAQYEPELFPGLIFRMTKPKCVALLFRTGKFIITGLKSIYDIDAVWANLYDNVLLNYVDTANSATTSSSEYRKMSSAKKDTLSQLIDTINHMEMTEEAVAARVKNLNARFPVLKELADILNLDRVYRDRSATTDEGSVTKRRKTAL